MSVNDKTPIRLAEIGGQYFTPRGLKVQVLRHRGDDVVVECITSGGHEIVIPGGLLVVCDVAAAEKPSDGVQSKEFMVFRVFQESKVPVDRIAMLTGLSVDIVEAEMHAMLSPVLVN